MLIQCFFDDLKLQIDENRLSAITFELFKRMNRLNEKDAYLLIKI